MYIDLRTILLFVVCSCTTFYIGVYVGEVYPLGPSCNIEPVNPLAIAVQPLINQGSNDADNCLPNSFEQQAAHTPVDTTGTSVNCIGYPQHDVTRVESAVYKLSGKVKGGVLKEAFGQLHHPGIPVTTELLIDVHHNLTLATKERDPYQSCQEIYLTRTGAATNLRNKCVGVAMVPEGHASPYYLSHRGGMSANMAAKYQNDQVDKPALQDEVSFLPIFLKYMPTLVNEFRTKMGDPVLPSGQRRALTVMVANEGVIDLVMNFLCSCRAAGIDVSEKLVIFLGQPEYAPLFDNMGVKTFFHKALGQIPKKAAGFYGDKTFGVLMWLKTTSVYVASRAGFNVLFQDADLVWFQDPFPSLLNQSYDITFMDDGARTTRFTPLFVNSGFYFQKYTPRVSFLMEKMIKAVSEIATTHSHQSVLTRHITELHHLVGLQIGVLELEQFPSGIMYHHEKKYLKKVTDYQLVPNVFHMCWTESRKEKVTYFKDIGMWFLPDSTRQPLCESPTLMMQWLGKQHTNNILDECCEMGDYWRKRPRSSTSSSRTG